MFGDTGSGGSWTPSKNGEVYLIESDSVIRQTPIPPGEYDAPHGPAVAKIGDNIIGVQVDASNHPDSSGQKDILRWNYGKRVPEIVGTLSRKHNFGQAGIVSGRFFPECKGKSL